MSRYKTIMKRRKSKQLKNFLLYKLKNAVVWRAMRPLYE